MKMRLGCERVWLTMKPGRIDIEYKETDDRQGRIYFLFNGERVACVEPRRVPALLMKLISIVGNWHVTNRYSGP